MTIFEYISFANPNGAKNVVNTFGEKAKRNPQELSRQVATMVNRFGQEALFKIAENHPDKELLRQYFEIKNKENVDKSCGCDKKESLFSSVEGQALKEKVDELTTKQEITSNQPKDTRSEKTELLIIGAIALVGLALVLKK